MCIRDRERTSVASDDVPAVPTPPGGPTADDAVPIDVEAMRAAVRAQLREELRAQVAAELRAEMMRTAVPAVPPAAPPAVYAASCAADEDARAEREAWEGKAGMRE